MECLGGSWGTVRQTVEVQQTPGALTEGLLSVSKAGLVSSEMLARLLAVY